MNFRIAPRTVQKLTVEKLREAIIAGVFKPGDRLVEADLCKMLGVSRPSVREALRSLEAERLIAIVPNRGTQVPIVPWEEAQEIYHVRSLLEGEAAALSVERARPDHLGIMGAALDEFAAAVTSDDMSALLATTERFYDVLLDCCGNKIIAEMLRGLLARIGFLRARSMSRPGRPQHSLKEMKAILSAVEKKDAKGARRAAERHVMNAAVSAHESYVHEGLGSTSTQSGEKPVPPISRCR